MKTNRSNVGKWLYGILFLIVLPALLGAWSYGTEAMVGLPAIHHPAWGIGIGGAGLLLMLWGMFALWRYGRGLPMNAFPPVRYVNQGPYRWLRHPIYWGFSLFLVGASVFSGSASGLWLVTPAAILGMAALVWGYERPDLAQRFPGADKKVWFSLPEKSMEPPEPGQRLAVLIQVVAFWLLGANVWGFLAGNILPAVQWPWPLGQMSGAGFFFGFSWLFLLLVPLVVKTRLEVRQWGTGALAGSALALYLAFLWPAVGGQFLPDAPYQGAVIFWNIPICDFFVMPVFLVLLAARAYARAFPRLKVWMAFIGIGLALGLVAFSTAPWLHLLSGIVVYGFASNLASIWPALRGMAEWVANSWKEWVFGPVRVINHGFYVGAGAVLGTLIIGWLAGEAYAWAVVLFGAVSIVFSALWAQLIEGSEKLKRPYGYYGALVGILFSSLAVWAAGFQVWVVIGAFSVVMPWVQGIGRLRCLVNGCCHGAPVDNEKVGIRYFHPRSRVCGISDMKGQTLHPTPLYAILWLFFVGFILLALWQWGLPFPFIFGMYLLLTGLGRFVEEAYRGEVQTPILYGLRLYQWTAIASVLVGIVFTMIPASRPILEPTFGWNIVWAALVIGVFTFFAMGVDFPRSNVRFSRLV
ncbi:MAG: prolipoprotein diacylglyceryl transferase [Lewinellaceae bacterium]|nr:prolipoprotein diacylglyceryl transferase [Lewinellaceae bacterium]